MLASGLGPRLDVSEFGLFVQSNDPNAKDRVVAALGGVRDLVVVSSISQVNRGVFICLTSFHFPTIFRVAEECRKAGLTQIGIQKIPIAA